MQIKKFAFDLPVVRVFDDMIERSVPFYSEVLKMCAQLLRYFLPDEALIYDLGCSTGNFVPILLKIFDEKPFFYMGIDTSSDMLSEARKRHKTYKNIKFINSALEESDMENAYGVCLNYTLQFIDVSRRSLVLAKIFNALRPGGVLILSEKIFTENQAYEEQHINFKKEQGYSKLEIAQKRAALDEVLTPLGFEENIKNLHQAGFKTTEVFFQWYNFVSIFARK